MSRSTVHLAYRSYSVDDCACGRTDRFQRAPVLHWSVRNLPPFSTSFFCSRCCIAGGRLNLARTFCSTVRTISPTGSSRMIVLLASSRLVQWLLLRVRRVKRFQETGWRRSVEGGRGLHHEQIRSAAVVENSDAHLQLVFWRHILRETIVHRTHGAHKNLPARIYHINV